MSIAATTRRALSLAACLVTTIAAYAEPPVLHADRVVNIAPSPAQRDTGDMIVFTANQSWLSRIYLMDTTGAVSRYFEYDFYRFADLEVVGNEVYAAEAFAPRVLKVDLATGDLEVIVDDWSLYYFYDLAFDGQYFYVNEWDLNRYMFDGTKVGTASFDGSVWGAAWDGTYYWTVTDENLVKCWDLASWPTLTELPANAITPPSPDCRGLWFDGEMFWTAESRDGALGYIYRFDYNGKIKDRWLEPAFAGWGVCLVRHLPGDIDNDGDVDIGDYTRFAPCLAGPAITVPPTGCLPADFPQADLDADTDVDLRDYAHFCTAFNPAE